MKKEIQELSFEEQMKQEEAIVEEQEIKSEQGTDVQTLRRKLDLLVRTACLLMASNADCARIMRNLHRCEA